MKKLFIFLLISSLIFAKDINVGDLIRLKVEGVEKEEIIKGFEDSKLQLEEIKDSEDSYIISVRGYTTGENSVVIGDKKLTFNIKSVLDEKDKEIYPHLSDNSDNSLYLPKFPYQIVIGGILGFLSLIYLLKGIKFKKREKILTPEERFENIISNLDENWEFQLSLALREYIDSRYNSHFINGNYNIIGMIDSEDIKFIEKLDRYKFSKEKKEFQEEVLKQVKEIFNKVKGDKKDV